MFSKSEVKKSVIFLISLAIFVLLSTYFGTIEWKTFNNCIEISGNEVDNNYNNSLVYSNGFCRVNNKLYYSYLKNTRHHGIMEISSSGTRRIYRVPLYWLTASTTFWRYMYKCGNGFYRLPLGGTLEFFDVSTKKIVDTKILKYDPFVSARRMVFYEDNIYYISSEPMRIVKNNKKGSEIAMIEDVNDFYIYKDNIYYTKSGSENVQILFKCDLDGNQNKQVLSYKVSDKINYISNYIIEKDYLIFRNPNSEHKSFMYKWKLDGSSGSSMEQICDKEVASFNVFDGKIYICTNGGIYVVDLETNQKTSVTSKKAESCYIVDDKWVYFISDDAILWRVTNDGIKIEKVFG